MTSTKNVDVSRRDFLNSAVGVGFALAVQPIAASAILTDGDGLSAGAVEIPTGPATMPGYAARPAAASGPLPVVLVVQEIFGVHEHIRDLCRRLAKAGYLAVAPELYFRQGDPSKVASISELVSGLVSKVPDKQVLADLDATLAWADGNGGDAKRAAITGFCWGGRQVWLYAAHNRRLKAGVAWYGRLQGEAGANTPRQPLDVVSQLHAPVLGLYGGLDKGIPLESVDKMKAALRAAGKPAEIVVYPEADHGFNADYRPSYNAAAANDGWQRMLQWFKQHGV